MKRRLSPTMRRRLDVQGFEDVDDERLAEVGPWLGMAFVGCAILAGVGTFTASTEILWALVTIAALAAILPVHPFDLIYNYGIRRLTGTRSLPQRGAPSRFACGVGAVWLIAVILLFEGGYMAAAYVLGGLLTLVAMLVGTTNICIPSMIYRAVFRKAVEPRID